MIKNSSCISKLQPILVAPKGMGTLPIQNSVIFTMSVRMGFRKPNFVLMASYLRMAIPIKKNGITVYLLTLFLFSLVKFDLYLNLSIFSDYPFNVECGSREYVRKLF